MNPNTSGNLVLSKPCWKLISNFIGDNFDPGMSYLFECNCKASNKKVLRFIEGTKSLVTSLV